MRFGHRPPTPTKPPVSSVPVSTPPAVDADASPSPSRDRGSGSSRGGKAKRRTFAQRVEAWLSRLSTRNTFFQRAFSLVYLPFAWRSGISMKRLGESRFIAILPFTRFNRNWYNAMAGASLLGNSEVAGGLYLFARCGGDYMVVCKEMKYRFLRPCFGPAVYEVVRSGDLDERLKAGGEFNIDLEMDIRQQLRKKGKELLVGRCSITFHCTPKAMAQAKAERRRVRPASTIPPA